MLKADINYLTLFETKTFQVNKTHVIYDLADSNNFLSLNDVRCLMDKTLSYPTRFNWNQLASKSRTVDICGSN